ncbi:CAAX amino terminal protease family protein [Wolffia australiana]
MAYLVVVGCRAAPPLTWATAPPCRVALRRREELILLGSTLKGASIFTRGSFLRQRSTAELQFDRPVERRELRRFVCCSTAGDEESEVGWPIFDRWDVPWKWQTVVLTMVASGLSFVLVGLSEALVLPYLGIQGASLSMDEKAEVLFLGQLLATAVVLGVVFGITSSFRPFPNDVFRYDVREPLKLRDGWLLWAAIGFTGAVAAIALTGVASSLFTGDNPQRDTDALVQLLPLIGSSSASTAFLVGITGVLAPLLEETVFRGFLMASLTKWFPTPVAALASAAAFALAHLTPGEFPQLFVLGSILGLSYAQTRNLLTPIAIHSLWNSGVIILLTFLQLQGYDIKQLVQGP